jgi:DMSO/TMAO reductase YedYZ molybdopterin-dependent catalytic subunit
MRRLCAAIAALILVTAQASAQSPSLLLEGKVKQPQRVTLADLKKLPAEHVTVSYQTERGVVTGAFTGVFLWSLIGAAGGIADDAKGAAVRHAIRITAKDDYVVVTSTGEIAPDFGNKPALVAYERDGKPLADFRLVMPGDKHGGRNLRDIVSIAVE